MLDSPVSCRRQAQREGARSAETQLDRSKIGSADRPTIGISLNEEKGWSAARRDMTADCWHTAIAARLRGMSGSFVPAHIAGDAQLG